MENNLKTADCASVVNAFDAISERMDELTIRARDLFCLSALLEERVDAVLFTTAQRHAESDYYLIEGPERKIIGFLDKEVHGRAEQLDAMAGALSDQLSAALSAMQTPSESRRVVVGHANPVDDAIMSWRYAYDHWRETVGEDRDKADAPEEAAEEEARKALVSVPCKSLYDVQRKAELFSTHPYLSGLTADHVDDLLRSFFPH